MDLRSKQIGALFVECNGVYFNCDHVDPWCEHRDAMNYDKNYPVVAHPPCNLWGKFAVINYKRWGGDHNKPGNDGGKFKFALDCVNRLGGVLEHPSQSYAWPEYGLVKPIFGEWIKSGLGWVTEVYQCAYGHKAKKATWLYCRGELKPFDLDWRKAEYTHQIGFHDQRGKENNRKTVSGKEASRTPLRFRDMLCRLALNEQR